MKNLKFIWLWLVTFLLKMVIIQKKEVTPTQAVLQVRLRPGMTLWRYEAKRNKVSIVDLKLGKYDNTGSIFRMMWEPDCLYTPALNLKRAEEKFRQMIEEFTHRALKDNTRMKAA